MRKLPGKRSTTDQMTEEQKEADQKFSRCPKGHALPHRTNKGLCSPLFCAGSIKGAKSTAKPVQPKPAKVKQDALEKAARGELADLGFDIEAAGVEEATAQTTGKIVQAHGRYTARQAYLKVPEFKDARERDTWVENKKMELVPLALANVEYSLKLGDSIERERAGSKILDMTGHGKKDGGSGNSAPLIMLIGAPTTPGQGPWVRRIDKDGKELPMIEGQIAPKQS